VSDEIELKDNYGNEITLTKRYHNGIYTHTIDIMICGNNDYEMPTGSESFTLNSDQLDELKTFLNDMARHQS
jgi:hypothetical protein